METSEIQELLEKMNVLKKQEQSLSINGGSNCFK